MLVRVFDVTYETLRNRNLYTSRCLRMMAATRALGSVGFLSAFGSTDHKLLRMLEPLLHFAAR